MVNELINTGTRVVSNEIEMLPSPSNTTCYGRVADMNLNISDEVNTLSDLELGSLNERE